jgi:hypothetical protein
MPRAEPPATELGLRLVADLGVRPTVNEVTAYLEALDGLWGDVLVAASPEHQARLHAAQMRQLAVRRLRIESPLDTVLTSVQDLTPVGFAAAVWVGFERVTRLLMEWQKHRMDLRERGANLDAAHVVARSTNLLATRTQSLETLAQYRILSVQLVGEETGPPVYDPGDIDKSE